MHVDHEIHWNRIHQVYFEIRYPRQRVSIHLTYIKRGNTDMDQDLRELSREFPC